MNTKSIVSRDRELLWHPYASTTNPGPLHVVRAASGTRLTLDDGAEVVDAMSSWWCMIHGYRNPLLDAALHERIGGFSHVMFGGLTHEPAVALATELARIAPGDLSRTFLADSGSVAVEVSLKLARQVQLARGHARRTRVASLRGGYHGDTLGAMSVCDPVGGMHAMYAGSVPEQVFLPRPPRFNATEREIAAWVHDARSIVLQHADSLAAIIVEPVLQGAGGMWPWAPGALTDLRAIADESGLLLIADEIATGFGRTGTLFACERAAIVADVLVLGKAMTGGYLTQAAVMTSDAIATEIGNGPAGALMHGPTFMANPLACAASLASLSLLATGAWRGQVEGIESALRSGLAPARNLESVAEVRVLGACGAIELVGPVDMAKATATALEHGVWLRPFGKLVYTMPPYIASEDDIARICEAMLAVAAEVQP